jgi:hypothetical protein
MNNCHVIENDYLYSDNIRFVMAKEEISPKIRGLLVRRFNLINEAQVVEKIEEALMAFYELPLVEIQSQDKGSYDAYVYIYSDPTQEGSWHLYGNEFIKHKPLYIGKGQGDRSGIHLSYTHNSELDLAIKRLSAQGQHPIIKLYNKGCTDLMAFNLESYMIARLREQGVHLCNATLQRISKFYDKEIIISEMNLEKLESLLIVEALNDDKCRGNRGQAAKLLGISERTLYRKIKSLQIICDDGYYRLNDNMSPSFIGFTRDTYSFDGLAEICATSEDGTEVDNMVTETIKKEGNEE